MSNTDVLKKQIASARGRVTEALRAASAIQTEAVATSDAVRRLKSQADGAADAGQVENVVTLEAQIAANERILRRLHPRWHAASENVKLMRGELAKLELQAAVAEQEAAKAEVDQAMAVLEVARRRLGEATTRRDKRERALEELPENTSKVPGFRMLKGSPEQIAKQAQEPDCTCDPLALAEVLDGWAKGVGVPARYPSKCLIFFAGESGEIVQPPLIFATVPRPGSGDETAALANADECRFRESEFLSAHATAPC